MTLLHAVRGCDYAAVLRATGIAALTQISEAADVAAAIQSLAVYAVDLPPAERQMLHREALDHLLAIRVDGAKRVLDGEMRLARSIARSDRAPRAAVVSIAGDQLPDGVDPHTDTAQAHRIVRLHGADLRHCPPLGGWIVWGGRIWSRDDAAARRRAIDTAIAIMRHGAATLEQARERGEQDAAQALVNWARRAQAEPSIRRALDLARSLEPIACGADVWDCDPWLIACVSGTLDLRSGSMGPHVREHYITRLSGDPA